jgi:chemotaxis protein MotB
MAAKDRKGDKGSVVIRKEESVEGGHHGGAWKVAYADFVTAMMAFFLLMWLVNATTEEQRRGLADYFSPTAVISDSRSGNGQPLGGKTPFEDGAQVSDLGTVAIRPGQKSSLASPLDRKDAEQAPADGEPAMEGGRHRASTGGSGGKAATARPVSGPRAPGGGTAAAEAQAPVPGGTSLAHAAADPAAARPLDAAAFKAERDRRERAAFERAAAEIRQAITGDPALAGLSRQLGIDVTPQGLRIQLLDEDRLPMFATGSSEPNERARLLLRRIAPVLARLPEEIAISGHTDAAPYRGTGKTNWDLSTERANATRRLLVEGGLAETRFRRVSGVADRDPLLPADPLAAANRRIAILVLRDNARAPATGP